MTKPRRNCDEFVAASLERGNPGHLWTGLLVSHSQ
jgi:hypothetical protein